MTPAYLSLDYNPPYDVAFITLKYAHRRIVLAERTIYAYCTRVHSSRKERKKERKKEKEGRIRERKEKSGMIRNKGQRVTMTPHRFSSRIDAIMRPPGLSWARYSWNDRIIADLSSAIVYLLFIKILSCTENLFEIDKCKLIETLNEEQVDTITLVSIVKVCDVIRFSISSEF